ncbi:SusC/RagA family TonB-linked outer membrane protein [Spirosoma sp. KUDC1026]|uniref:SusC/RagA family TonB-linked outer membrane protein n=1 Tax=Spirosoma sp. KUDC1026 TaxID=2745947 RepID=UPI00159B87A3|nr:SusC/RagA family TonB-linked outer membrane protein [Spirosoma sp. KUDC1026]QKZ13682.1 SusC/RagA family TonB-linked outer membrane protein [Spirosoma sp. KUDC1026]
MRQILSVGLVFLLVLTSGGVWAQGRLVSGKVTSSTDGSALPGVNVVVKGTSNGTVTDSDGMYKLTVPSANSTLVFSFIGHITKEQPIGGQAVVDVTLADDTKQLTEVVVTAQGILKTRNELSYAAQTVTGEMLSQTRDANFVNALSGKVAGVQIQKNNGLGGSTGIVIRGWKSLSGSNQALFVVDGVPIDNSTNNASGTSRGTAGYDYGNAAADINPDDIESTTILKGPAATALYGSRASNGVVFITTKKGRKKGLGVSINTGVTFSNADRSTFPTYQKQYGAGYGKYYGPTKDGYFDQADVNGDGIADNIVPTYEDASVGAPFDPSLSVYQWNAFGDPTSPTYKKATPWVAAANDPFSYFQQGVTTNNSVTIDGGSDKGFFKLGYTLNKDKGIMPNSHLKKDYLNFSASYEVVKRLTATGSINFTNIEGRGRYAQGYGGNNAVSMFREWWQVNVDLKELEAAYQRTGQNITWNWASGLPNTTKTIYWDNPYFAAYENAPNDNRLRYFGYTRLDYKITDWLNAMGRVSLDSYSQRQEERTAVSSVVFPAGRYIRRDLTFQEYNYDFLLTANKNLTPNLALKAAAGVNIRKTMQNGMSAQTNGGLVVPKIYALSNSVNPIEAPNERDYYLSKQVNGYYADGEIGYKDFIFLNGSFRRDVASSLPVGGNAYNYGQISTSFVFSKFVPENSIFTFGKLRLNYAEVGADAPFNSLTDLYDKPTAFGSIPLFSVPGTKNNSNLRPERTKSYEAGIETSFLNGRLGLDVTYFNSRSVDQIIPVTVSTATGYNSKYVNAGILENKGIEVSLTGSPVKVGNFRWDVNLNWTRIRNKVVELYGNVTNFSLPGGSFQASGSSNAPLGRSYGTIYGTDYIYTNGQPTVDAQTGRYLRTTTATNEIGNINPDWLAGFQNTLRYKNLSLSFLLDAKKGGDILSVDMYYGLATGLYQESAGLNELGNLIRSPVAQGGGILLPGVNADGSVNKTRLNMLDYPQAGTQTAGPTHRYIYDASYLKLREVLLTYSLPATIVNKLSPLRNLSVSLVGRNLWIIMKNIPYADPEDNLGAGNIQGVQVGSLPNVRTLGFNINASF